MKLPHLALASLLPIIVACGAPASRSGSSSAAATAEDDSSDAGADIPANFDTVIAGIYRGGHPDQGGLDYLQSLGVTTIVDLEIGDFVEATPWSIDDEISEATAMGLNDIREPMSAFTFGISASFDDEVTQALTILADPAQKPVYVHCAHGQDRTGLIIGLERVINEGWAPADAWQEMLAHGFHQGFLGLDAYFFRRTGWTPLDDSTSTNAHRRD